MESREIEEFAEILIKEVRDRALSNCDRQLLENAKSPSAKRWRSLKALENQELVKAVISDSVDQTIANLLTAIDQKILKLKFKSGDTEVDLSEADDELTGWYMGSGGWREKYSSQRFFDDFKDL